MKPCNQITEEDIKNMTKEEMETFVMNSPPIPLGLAYIRHAARMFRWSGYPHGDAELKRFQLQAKYNTTSQFDIHAPPLGHYSGGEWLGWAGHFPYKKRYWHVRFMDRCWKWYPPKKQNPDWDEIDILVFGCLPKYRAYVLKLDRIQKRTGKRPEHWDLDKIALKSILPTDEWVAHVSTGTFPAYDGTEHQFDRIEKVIPDLSGEWRNINTDLHTSA